MKDALHFVGAMLIIVCLIFCVMQITSKDWEEAFSPSYSFESNLYSIITKEMSKLYISSTVAVAISGFLSGLLLLALSKIIELLERMQPPSEEPLQKNE